MDNVSSAGIRKTKPLEVICVIDVLLLDIAQVLFCMFMNLDLMSAHKHIRKEQGQYPAILLTVQAWSIKDLLYGKETPHGRGVINMSLGREVQPGPSYPDPVKNTIFSLERVRNPQQLR